MVKGVIILNHQRAHFSDFGADFLLQAYGEHVWPGITRSHILVTDGTIIRDDEGHSDYSLAKLQRDGWTVVGVGPVEVPGVRYDEHFLDERPGEIRTCEMVLVAEALKLDGETALADLLEYARAVDRHGEGKKPFYLGRVVEIMHDAFPEEQVVREWAYEAFTAELGCPSYSEADLKRSKLLFHESFERARHDFSKEVSDSVRYLAGKMMDARGKAYRFTVLDAAARLVALGRRVVPWLERGIRAELMKQHDFNETRRDYEHHTRIEGPMKGTWKHESFTVLFIRSDARWVHSYAFRQNPKAAVVIVRRSSGHVQVFVNLRWSEILPHRKLAINVRRAEQALSGIVNVPDEMLALPAGPLGAANWFYQKDTGNLYNGSLTAVKPTTALSDTEILEAVIAAVKR